MTTNAQGRSASELSASLVRDYRAMISSLEQTRPEGPALPPQAVETSSSEAPGMSERKMAEPVIRSLRATPASSAPAGSETRPAPLGFAELRSKLSALSDTRNIISSRRPADAAATEAAAASPAGSAEAAVDAQAARRRMFGAPSRTESEPVTRRRRPASREAFTWQRLGVLAVCIAALGGAAMALQSVVGRDEARVAPEVIGNAAIAAVAPSAPAPAVAAPTRVAVVEPASPPAPVLRMTEAVTPPPVMPSISARTLLAPEPTEPGPAVRGLTAFAAPEPSPLAVVAPETELPRRAPLPPPAPPRRVAALAPAAAAPAVAVQADEVADAAVSSETSGAAPTGGATIRSPVTMRTAPNKGAAAMQTLKSGQQVELVACGSWCEIVADGKRGFIYKTFLSPGAPKEADASGTE
ncbi:SH3 domain-containing protein [Ancylobacter sp. Lp-2]|uniref:SH3 domain-containing protein n=1 Tax=Ancylobacter sp. Lp-2 TaxID=2881339 RepID=UPI001E3A2D95|nr:SH3 domain-containing protein [Ancylobacter sp. Lp-2]MCB4770285.1 SH3 domain-containing protein [Ancylobacter sp. Lp-2]